MFQRGEKLFTGIFCNMLVLLYRVQPGSPKLLILHISMGKAVITTEVDQSVTRIVCLLSLFIMYHFISQYCLMCSLPLFLLLSRILDMVTSHVHPLFQGLRIKFQRREVKLPCKVLFHKIMVLIEIYNLDEEILI